MYPSILRLFEKGNLKSVFVISDYRTPEEMKEEFERFCVAKRYIEPLIARVEEGLWQMRLSQLVEVGEPPTTIRYDYPFYIIPHLGFWEFHTNVRRDVVDEVLDGLVKFSPKLEHIFIPPEHLMALVKEYETDEMLAFMAERDYFTLMKTSQFKIISDELSLSLRSTPQNIWNHYRKLVEEETIGPLTIKAVRLRITQAQKECKLSVTTAGGIYQRSGDKELFENVRQRIIQILEKEVECVRYFPQITTKLIEKEGTKIIKPEVVQKGVSFVIRLSKTLDEEKYEKLKGLFVWNAKNSGFVGIVEDEIKNLSFIVRTTDLKGGGSILLKAEVGKDKITIDPLPITTIRCLQKLYKVILEKFDTKACLLIP
jgi:hypothetical protein